MKLRKLWLLIAALCALLVSACQPIIATEASVTEASSLPSIRILKGWGTVTQSSYGLTKADYEMAADSGFTHVQPEIDICEMEYQETVQEMLDWAHEYGLKVILPAGAGEAEWGYPCPDASSYYGEPQWQSDAVIAWVTHWKDHPAVAMWDISNEGGGNFVHGEIEMLINPILALTADHLTVAVADLKKTDSSHPRLMRMNGWIFFEQPSFFDYPGNPFAAGLADYVMVNAYSHIRDEPHPTFVATVLDKAIAAIHAIDPNVMIIPALGVQTDELWETPTPELLEVEWNTALSYKPVGIAVYAYGTPGSDWYLPVDAPEIWAKLKELNSK